MSFSPTHLKIFQGHSLYEGFVCRESNNVKEFISCEKKLDKDEGLEQ